MPNYITIDGGTTNTRIRLVAEGKILDTEKKQIGARQGLSAPDLLKEAIGDGLKAILDRNGFKEADISAIIASGMITSEGGLCAVPHLKAPCGIEELQAGLYEKAFPEISAVPFTFIRGVKTGGDHYADTDMMRGEETELMGLASGLAESTLYVLPGSHSKLVETDEKGRITAFSTQLTGEMMSAVASGTILQNSVKLEEGAIDEAFLKKGFLYAKEKGISAAFFKVRVLDKLLGCTKAEVFSFFLGVALSPEIINILNWNGENVVIGGKAALKVPTGLLVRAFSEKNVREIGEEEAEYATARGAIRIFEYKRGEENGETL